MKTALEWSKYLPQAIKQWFIIEATNQKYKKKTKFNYLVGALDEAINFEESELGYDFWYGIYILAKDYKGREAEILTDLEWIDELKVSDGQVAPKWGELVEAPKEKKSSTNSSVIKTLKAENEALKADIFHLEETIELQKETIDTLTQMKVAPKKEQSIFFDLLEHLNIIKK